MTKVDWLSTEEIPNSFALLGIDGNVLDVGDGYRLLRKNDMLYAPRINNMYLVVETPTSASVEVRGDFRVYPYAFMETVAKYFGVAISTVKRWCWMGVIPADKNKGCWQIPYTFVMDEIFELVIGDSLIILSPARADGLLA